MAFLAPSTDVSVGPLQFEALCALWTMENRRGTVEQVVYAVNAAHERNGMKKLAYTTLLTVMRNMHHRGILLRERAGRKDIYQVRMTDDQFLGKLGKEFLAAYFGGDIRNLQEALPHAG